MKKKILISLIPLTLVAAFGFSYFRKAQEGSPSIKGNESRNELIRKVTMHIVQRTHFKQPIINDAFSEKAFESYLKKLDNSKYFLLQSDVDDFAQYSRLMDDEFRGMPLPLYKKAKAVIVERTDEVAEIIEEALKEPFDFSETEFIELNGKKRKFAANREELKANWRKYLKYQALIRYYSRLNPKKTEEGEGENQTEKKADEKKTDENKSPEEIEKEIRERLSEEYKNRFNALKKRDDEDFFSDYINAILSVYGPHTGYFPPPDKENFDINISGRMEGIGAQLTLYDNEIKIVKIIPGSASWKQKELEAGDVILKVGQGDEEPVNIVGWSTKDAVKLIRGKKGTEVRLVVRKADGLIKTISIIRDVVLMEETYAKSALVTTKKTGKRYGVIKLPSFYVDFNKKHNARSSSEDVKKELVKLKSQDIDGVILDLRGNGGGSLEDAVKIAGCFINKGPVVQVKAPWGSPTILKDEKRGMVYDGPLAVMVNKFSASASEIFAAAMQDYGRAVVVGSEHTFGKGTVQRFYDLDQSLPSQFADMKPTGSLKTTIQKYYRISGKSTQFKGVTADIVLPDTYRYMPYGEKDADYAMPWDEIDPVGFTPWKSDKFSYNLKKLANKSAKRKKQEKLFAMVEENAKRLREQYDQTYQTLEYEGFKNHQDQLNTVAEEFKNLNKKHEDLTVEGLAFDLAMNQNDTIKMKNMEDWFAEIEKDIYIRETAEVLNDVLD